MNRWISNFASLMTPIAGFALGVWRTNYWIRGLSVGTSKWGDDANLDNLSILIASLVVFLLLLPPFLRRGVAARRSPSAFTLSMFSLLYLTTGLVLILGAAGVGIDLLGLIQADILHSPDSLVRKVFLLTLCIAALSIASSSSRFPPIEALNGVAFTSRNQVYDFLRTLTSSMSAERTTMVTSFERLHQHYVSESETCKKWMSGWTRTVQQKKIPVLHLLRIYNEANLVDDLKERLESYANAPDYEIRMLLAPPILPIVDLYYEKERFALLCFPKDPLRQYLTEQFIFLSEPRSLLVIEQWFTSMWNHGLVIKEPSGDSAGLNEARQRLAELSQCDANILEMSPELVITGARIAPEALSLLAELSKLADVGILRSQWGASVRNRLTSLLDDVRAFTAGNYQHYSSISEALIVAFEESQTRVQCTSVISGTDRFWTERQDTLERLSNLARNKGLRVERIFIFPNDDLREKYMTLMRAQLDEHTRIFYTVTANQCTDFAVIDGRFVVIDNLLSAVRSSIPDDIKRCAEEYGDLLNRSTEVDGKGTPLETRDVPPVSTDHAAEESTKAQGGNSLKRVRRRRL